MKTSTCAELRVEFPDDSVWEGDEIVQFGGRNVTAAIRELVAELGYRVSEPIDGDEHGWWLNINHEEREFLIQVTDLPPETILLTDDVTFFLNRWFSKNGHLYGEFVGKLKTAIEADPRFHHIRWFEHDNIGRELGSDGKPLSTAQLKAQALARQAELAKDDRS